MNGWICPRCSAVWAPFVDRCGNCSGVYQSIGNAITNPDKCDVCHMPRSCPGGTGCPPGSHYGTYTVSYGGEVFLP